MKKLLLMLSLATVSFISCKKKDVEKTTAEKIQGVWKLETYKSNDFFSNMNHFSDYNGVAADYFDFRTDNKVYSQFSSVKDTAAYTIVNDNTIKIDGDSYTIQTINDQQFKIYFKEIDPVTPTEYYEETLTLKK